MVVSVSNLLQIFRQFQLSNTKLLIMQWDISFLIKID